MTADRDRLTAEIKRLEQASTRSQVEDMQAQLTDLKKTVIDIISNKRQRVDTPIEGRQQTEDAQPQPTLTDPADTEMPDAEEAPEQGQLNQNAQDALDIICPNRHNSPFKDMSWEELQQQRMVVSPHQPIHETVPDSIWIAMDNQEEPPTPRVFNANQGASIIRDMLTLENRETVQWWCVRLLELLMQCDSRFTVDEAEVYPPFLPYSSIKLLTKTTQIADLKSGLDQIVIQFDSTYAFGKPGTGNGGPSEAGTPESPVIIQQVIAEMLQHQSTISAQESDHTRNTMIIFYTPGAGFGGHIDDTRYGSVMTYTVSGNSTILFSPTLQGKVEDGKFQFIDNPHTTTIQHTAGTLLTISGNSRFISKHGLPAMASGQGRISIAVRYITSPSRYHEAEAQRSHLQSLGQAASQPHIQAWQEDTHKQVRPGEQRVPVWQLPTQEPHQRAQAPHSTRTTDGHTTNNLPPQGQTPQHRQRPHVQVRFGHHTFGGPIGSHLQPPTQQPSRIQHTAGAGSYSGIPDTDWDEPVIMGYNKPIGPHQLVQALLQRHQQTFIQSVQTKFPEQTYGASLERLPHNQKWHRMSDGWGEAILMKIKSVDLRVARPGSYWAKITEQQQFCFTVLLPKGKEIFAVVTEVVRVQQHGRDQSGSAFKKAYLATGYDPHTGLHRALPHCSTLPEGEQEMRALWSPPSIAKVESGEAAIVALTLAVRAVSLVPLELFGKWQHHTGSMYSSDHNGRKNA